ncbi:MAG: paraquat-inducible protein A [Neisseriaceae bacterium]
MQASSRTTEVNNLSYSISSRDICCQFCTKSFEIETVNPGEQVKCPRCQETVIRIEKYPVAITVLYTGLALFAFILSFKFSLLSTIIPYTKQANTVAIWQILSLLTRHGSMFLAFVFLLFVLVLPLIFIVTVLYVYAGIYLQRNYRGLATVAKLVIGLKPWIMVDLFLVAITIALIKIRVLVTFQLGYTMLTLFSCSVFLARVVLTNSDYWLIDKVSEITEIKFDVSEELKGGPWQQNMRLRLQLAWALLITSIILYFPANLLPMMNTSRIFGQSYQNTLLEGVIMLWNSGDYLVSIIIFLVSFLLPIVKIFILMIILLTLSYKKIFPTIYLSRAHVLIERIGRWSMIDVFVIMVMTSVFHERIVSITPGVAIIYFALVVILTMLATAVVDTRFLWINEAENRLN